MQHEEQQHYSDTQYIVGPATVLGVLEQFQTSAEGVARFSQLVISEVEEGRVEPLKIALLMKTLEKIKERVNEVLSPYYLKEAEKYSEKTFAFKGAQIAIAEQGTKYDYSVCGDPVWNDLTNIIDTALEQRKEREVFLKPLKGPMDLIIEGEGITVHPPAKTSKTGISITIK